MAAGAAGTFIVADSSRIYSVAPGGSVTALAGGGWSSFADGAGTSALFAYPQGVAVDASGVVLVSDTGNHRIRVVTPGGVVSTLAGGSESDSADGLGTAASFSSPTSLAIHPSGGAVVVEMYRARVRTVSASGAVATLAGSGFQEYPARDGLGTAASFSYPKGVAVDGAGAVYVADSSNVRIIAADGFVSTLWRLNDGYPNSIAVDAAGTIFVSLGQRILSLSAGGNRTTTIASSAIYYGPPKDGYAQEVFFSAHSLAVDAEGQLAFIDSSASLLRKLSAAPDCAAGSFCPPGAGTNATCPANTFCPRCSSGPTACPAHAPLSTPGSAACALPDGWAVSPNASCFSGAGRGGFCCSPNALRAGCAACAAGTGACALFSPGDACASAADCGTNLCAGGCCCAASALLAPGCAACACWANASTTAATAGACLAAPPPPPPPACACAPPAPAPPPLPNSTTPRCLACEAFDASRQVEGLFILAAANPLNPSPGVDVAVGLPGSCASLAAAAAAQGMAPAEVAAMLPCLARPAFLLIDGANYTVLGPAAPLRLAALPEDCSSK